MCWGGIVGAHFHHVSCAPHVGNILPQIVSTLHTTISAAEEAAVDVETVTQIQRDNEAFRKALDEVDADAEKQREDDRAARDDAL